MSEQRTVDIPDEAYRAQGMEYYYDATSRDAIEAAAPFIDRAARIDELSLMRSRFAEVEALSGPGDFVSWREVRTEFSTRLAELEAQRDG